MEPKAERKIQTRRFGAALGCPSPSPHSAAAPLREEVVEEEAEVGEEEGEVAEEDHVKE